MNTIKNSYHQWQKTQEQIAFEGYRKIVAKTYLLPNQTEFTFEIVRVPRYVSIAAVTEAKEVILVKQFRPGPEEVLLSVPEGQVNEEEAPEEAVIRELLEETGYQAEQIIFLKEIPEAYSETRKLCYLALNCQRIQDQRLDDTEIIEVKVLTLDEFREVLRNPHDNQFSSVDIGYMALDYLGWL